MLNEPDLFELARCIYAGDLQAARSRLDLVRATARERTATTIIRARCTVEPLPQNEAPHPFPLPAPGSVPPTFDGKYSTPGTSLYDLERKKAAKAG